VARKFDEIRSRDHGQGLIEYMVMLALVLVLVIGMVQVIGAKAKSVFSQVASHLQQQPHEHD
jgi:Flp pilus assembly pilin Flp